MMTPLLAVLLVYAVAALIIGGLGFALSFVPEETIASQETG